MREDRRLQQPEAVGQPGGDQERGCREHARAEEQRPQDLGAGAEAEVEPVDEQGLHHEAAGQRVEGLEAGHLQDHTARAVEPHAPSRRPGGGGGGASSRRGSRE